MDSIRIVGPSNAARERARRERDVAQRAREVETRAKAVLHELDAKVGGCHYCTSGLYEVVPGGCPCSKTAHNGAVAHRSRYPSRSEVDRSPVEIRDGGAIIGFR